MVQSPWDKINPAKERERVAARPANTLHMLAMMLENSGDRSRTLVQKPALEIPETAMATFRASRTARMLG